ncbi:alpha/beta-hydrolase [Mytilinidion resinicola]|uniref:Carboxylic ester hydrolase n=1 Tax=Mytilinidion resinicola TaxID=574789 RepID=A0A6A6YRX7_9PEZI|nr:alpha/beta-hydrolase [Mytilinidion resinicola]KAF2811682.1 alpha/beta-hydrolase [Mytilinidion resinicola]
MRVTLLTSLFVSSATVLAALPTVTISGGTLVGTTTTLPSATASVNKFLGIPFAAVPTSTLRFATPQPAPTYGTIQANKWKPACMQQFTKLFDTPDPGESEDCLYLNVYVPSTGSTGKAVMFWIYGGDLQYGTASMPLYDGSSFAAFQDVIVVAANYRTNIFGFPHSSEIGSTQWNVGFYDQRLALQWVQSNIAAFGGDPAKVTIFGESSGATSVDRLVTTMPNNTPFRAAIMESGTSSVTPGSASNSTDSTEWNNLASGLGCSVTPPNLGCMQKIAATNIKSAIEARYTNNGAYINYGFPPIQDGVTNLVNPEAARLAGNIAKVPVLQGTNAQEGRLFSASFNGQNGLNLQYFVDNYIRGSNDADIVAAYPVPGTYPDQDSATAQCWTEWVYQCPASVVTADDATAGIPAWRYYFNASFANYGSVPGFTNRGVYHTIELPIVFGTYPSSGATAQEIALSSYVQTAWATFAKNPDGGPDPAWPKVSTGSGGAYIGILGNSGNTFANLTVVQSTNLDARCVQFFNSRYSQSKYGNSW